jgi:hypothetical protein
MLTGLLVIISPSLHRTLVVNLPTSYSGGPEFEPQSWDIISCQVFLVSFSNSEQVLVILFSNRLETLQFHFAVIHSQLSYHLVLHKRSSWESVAVYPTNRPAFPSHRTLHHLCVSIVLTQSDKLSGIRVPSVRTPNTKIGHWTQFWARAIHLQPRNLFL